MQHKKSPQGRGQGARKAVEPANSEAVQWPFGGDSNKARSHRDRAFFLSGRLSMLQCSIGSPQLLVNRISPVVENA